LGALLVLAACGGSGPKFKGSDITGADYGRGFALTDQYGHLRHLQDFRGKVVVLLFGYTHCPDVCPTTLAAIAQVMRQLGPDAARVQVLFATLDPQRDTQSLMGQYVAAFDPRFLGLYGDAAATRRTAKEFKIFYQKAPGAAPGSYSVDHSSQSYVFDTLGRLRLFERADEISVALPHDIRVLLKEAG
jgi:protein SCO1